MKKIPILLLLLLSGCNPETYMESVGHVHLETGDETSVGYFFFYSKNAASQCGPITIYIDDKVAGQLTSDYILTSNLCTTEPIEGKLLKVVTRTGNRQIMVKYEGCDIELTGSYNLQEGTCMAYPLEHNPS